MRTIWKFPLVEPGTPIEVEMPFNAKVVAFQTQKVIVPPPKVNPLGGDAMMPKYTKEEVPTIWAEVNCLGDKPSTMETRKFCIIGTGHILLPVLLGRWEYVGTTQLYDGTLVLHLYEFYADGRKKDA